MSKSGPPKKSPASKSSKRTVKRTSRRPAAIKKINLDLGDGLNYLSLGQAAEDTSFSEGYLTEMAHQGKLKAFKFEADWLTTRPWLAEFQKRLKDEVNSFGQEVQSSLNTFASQWVKLSLKKKRAKVNLKLPLKYSWSAIILVCLVAGLIIWGESRPPQAYKMLIAAGKVASQKTVVAEKFLSGVHQIYGWPTPLIIKSHAQYFSALDNFSRVSLLSMSRFNCSISAGSDYARGVGRRWAGDFSGLGAFLSRPKFSDEKITQSWQNFIRAHNGLKPLALWWEKVASTKARGIFLRGKVAGTSASSSDEAIKIADTESPQNKILKNFSQWAVRRITDLQAILEAVKNKIQ